MLAAGPDRTGRKFYEQSLKQKEEGGAPLERAAALAVFLGSAASDGITGKLLSAIWDPWQTLPEHREDLQRTDVYTLRRIVPKDRGLSWGTSAQPCGPTELEQSTKARKKTGRTGRTGKKGKK